MNLQVSVDYFIIIFSSVFSLRQMDAVLTQVLENEYGKYLGYYPPVYVISKCLEFWRPYFLDCKDETEFRKRLNSNNFFTNENSQTNEKEGNQPESKEIASFLKKQHEDSPKIKKKSLSWFFGNSKKDKATSQTDASPDNHSTINEGRSSPVEIAESTENMFYPCEGSEIDEDDESDVEGEYTFYHDTDDTDTMSIGTGSIRSAKELTEMYEKELKIKLVENFVNKDTKDEKKKAYKRSGSIKRLFSKSKK